MSSSVKYFSIYNLGCRVNAAESNLFAQKLINDGYVPINLSRDVINHDSTINNNPNLIFINTCSVTKKANVESLGLIRRLQKKYPLAKIIISGCASLKNLKINKNIQIINNSEKEKKLNKLNSLYYHQIKDKFSHTNRFLLKVQSGCTYFCTYCTVPYTRPYLWSLPINDAVNTVNKVVEDGYKEIIITGVNLDQYTPGFSDLVEALLTKTSVPLISFGSIPINCIDEKFVSLVSSFPSRVSPFLHIPIQSGSDQILKLMHRNYTKKIILEKFTLLKKSNIGNNSVNKTSPPPFSNKGSESDLKFGTDIIVGFPGETDFDFQETYDLCQQIGFSKIHVFKYSPRPGTAARELFLKSDKISKDIINFRSKKLRQLISQTKPPSHQKPDKKN